MIPLLRVKGGGRRGAAIWSTAVINIRNNSTANLKVYGGKKIRNIGISAHVDSGKTTLTERILFYTRKISEINEIKGKVGATMDFMDLERERGITIQSAATYTNWCGYNINIIDTPGHIDFTIEVERALRVLDSAVLVVCAVGKVQSQTYTVFRQISRYKIPFIAFINKLDRIYADPFDAFEQIKSRLHLNAGLLQIPIGIRNENTGLIDLIKERAIYFEGTNGLKVREDDIPPEYIAQAKDYKKLLIENLSNVDEKIGEMYLNEQNPSIEEIDAAIRRSVINRKFTPVLLGSALKNRGVQPLLDGVIKYLPDPSEVENKGFLMETGEQIVLDPSRTHSNPSVALAFKLESSKFGQLTYIRMYQGTVSKGHTLVNTRTNKKLRVPRIVHVHARNLKDVPSASAGDICAFFGVDCNSGDTFVADKSPLISLESMFIPEPVLSYSLEASKSDELLALAKALDRFQREDPTFKVSSDLETREVIISGMGELHLDIYLQRLKREYNVAVKCGKPKVSYRETIRQVERFNYLHKRQSGGHGQFARVIGRIEPLPIEKYDFLEFKNETTGTTLDRGYITAVEKGFFECCERGFMSGHKITGIRLVLEDGETHLVDSSEFSFKMAALGAIKDVFKKDSGYIIEPVMKIEVVYPVEYENVILPVIEERSGKILSLNMDEDFTTVNAEVPLNNMFGFSSILRQLTQGKGEFTMEYSHYHEAPQATQMELIKPFQEAQKLKEKKK